MKTPTITHCPGTLAQGHNSYSITCLRRVFKGRKVDHVLPYNKPDDQSDERLDFIENQKRISISGIQEKYSLILDKNKLRLTKDGEQGQYILKPIPNIGKRSDQIPANEHLTMQIARQIYGIETAENALVFFRNGEPAYITKRFDITDNGSKWACESFASLAGKTPQTHGEHYKYQGNYWDLFEIVKRFLPAYRIEMGKLFKLIVFNYLFSNGDAHLKNFAILETEYGDFRLCPGYDLLNTRLHIDDSEFALEDGLLPKNLAKGKIRDQFNLLAEKAELGLKQFQGIMNSMLSNSDKVEELISNSFLDEKAKRTYLQAYQTQIKKLARTN